MRAASAAQPATSVESGDDDGGIDFGFDDDEARGAEDLPGCASAGCEFDSVEAKTVPFGTEGSEEDGSWHVNFEVCLGALASEFKHSEYFSDCECGMESDAKDYGIEEFEAIEGLLQDIVQLRCVEQRAHF